MPYDVSEEIRETDTLPRARRGRWMATRTGGMGATYLVYDGPYVPWNDTPRFGPWLPVVAVNRITIIRFTEEPYKGHLKWYALTFYPGHEAWDATANHRLEELAEEKWLELRAEEKKRGH